MAKELAIIDIIASSDNIGENKCSIFFNWNFNFYVLTLRRLGIILSF